MSDSAPVATDLLGRQAESPDVEAAADDPIISKIVALLKQIYDPEIPLNLYDLGLIYDIRVEGLKAYITMTLTTPNCPVAESMPEQVAEVVRSLDEIDEVEVELTWDPPWSPDALSVEARLELGLL
jgi:FeS assembly SUF system protein